MNLGPGILPLVNAPANEMFRLMIEFFTTIVFKQPGFAPARGRERSPGV
jgi:hypothetical protein